MKRDHKDSCGGAAGGTVKGECSSMPSNGKAKMWEEGQQKQQQQRMDELLAALGYKVRASDMADVAQKLEQLEMVMGCAQEDGISHLASDTLQISIHEIN